MNGQKVATFVARKFTNGFASILPLDFISEGITVGFGSLAGSNEGLILIYLCM
jgi:hypothetical protein